MIYHVMARALLLGGGGGKRKRSIIGKFAQLLFVDRKAFSVNGKMNRYAHATIGKKVKFKKVSEKISSNFIKQTM